MSIEADLRARLTAAMKSRDLKTANVIRMINTKIMERRTAKGFKGEVNDALHVDVIAAYKKSLEKAREQYVAAGDRGADQVADLDFEIAVAAEFLPAQLGEAAVRDLVKAAIADAGVTDSKMAGRIVGTVMKANRGRVNAGLVKRIAEEELGG